MKWCVQFHTAWVTGSENAFSRSSRQNQSFCRQRHCSIPFIVYQAPVSEMQCCDHRNYGNLVSYIAWGFCVWESARCFSRGWAFRRYLNALVSPGTCRWLRRYEFTLKPFPQLVLIWVLSTLPSSYFHENWRNIITFKTHSFISALIKTGQQITKGFLLR